MDKDDLAGSLAAGGGEGETPKPGFWINTPKGKRVRLKKLGLVVINKEVNGRPGIVVEETK